MNYYVHNVPGRLRVKTPLAKKNPGAAAEIKSLLESTLGVDSTAVNTLTGSVVIKYDYAAVKSDDILALLHRKGYFDIEKAKTNDHYVEEAVSKAGSVIGKAIISIALDKMFEGSALSLLTVLI